MNNSGLKEDKYMISVLVMMSAYNGEKYIGKQIDSILKQKGVDVRLLIRDDGSNDGTLNILEEYLDDKRIRVIKGKNIGAANSFLELIRESERADYYAFSDQDDEWDCDKLSVAVENLNRISCKPGLYSSNTRLVDRNLLFIKEENDNPLTTLESALIKNYCTGCTAVFNQQLMDELQRYHPKYVVMHDWWINLVTLSLDGVSIYDRAPHMSYRQHGGNVSGAEVSYFGKIRNRLYKFFNSRYHRDMMAKEILNAYSDKISPANKEVLMNFALNSKRLVIRKNYRSRKLIDTMLFKVCVLFNRT